jgi:hypothetical protein
MRPVPSTRRLVVTVPKPIEEIREMTHTPGPWRVEISNKSPSLNIVGANNYPIGRIPCTPSICSDDEANARLIAAAPDLLSALRDMTDMFEHHINGLLGPDDAAARWDNARAAVAKATGTQP